MVFPSVPVYLDPPNWNQQQVQQPRSNTGGGGANDAMQLPLGAMAAVPPPPRAPEGSGMPSSSTARPNSMAERARLAKVPQPEPALKCPRCDSSNTKFCYYNNYSLSQPRHFCKTCRRYWTRGGALRNVPVGGGCRRNKRTKSGSSSKSSATANRQSGGASSSMVSTAMSSGLTGAIPTSLSSMSHHLPFLGSMHQHLPDVGAPNLGLSFSGIPPLGMQHVEGVESFPVASGGGIGRAGASLEQWRVQQAVQQQFPFLGGGLELPPPPPPPPTVPPLYHLELEGTGADSATFALGQTSMAKAASSSTLAAQLASVKMEGNPQRMSLQRQYLAMRQGENVWGTDTSSYGGSGAAHGGNGSGGGGSGWTINLAGFNSSSGGGNLL